MQRFAQLHRAIGISFRIINRGDKQYVKIETRDAKVNRQYPYAKSDADLLRSHIYEIFPGAYISSGCYGRNDASLTFRINP